VIKGGFQGPAHVQDSCGKVAFENFSFSRINVTILVRFIISIPFCMFRLYALISFSFFVSATCISVITDYNFVKTE